MAKTKAQVQFEADTTGFTSEIKKADASLKTLRKELTLNDAELKENGDSVELLSQRKEILQDELTESANKVESLRKKLDIAKKSFGDNSKEVYDLNNKLLDAQTAHQKIQNEVTQTNNRLNNLSDGLNDVKQELNNTNKATENLGDGFTIMNGAMADLVAGGISELSGALKDLVVDSNTAYSNFQAQTGASTDEMVEFEGAIEKIYSKNYGESINDIANAMAEVKQQTKETDPSNLQKMTENALMLRDTFDMDIRESMRAVNMLTQQFGITGEEAFNLIVQGAQNGLDKNGDLLDTINEYSVHYKKLGFTSDQFFNSLVNGASTGTFSVDKLGDAMKEFGIRAIDNSDATNQAFKDLGLNASEMGKAFSSGGEESQKAFDKMWTALVSLEDPIKQNEIGVALFGTMWEDLGMDAVSALSDVSNWSENTNVAIDSSKNSMEELSKVKMDNVSAQMSEVGRQIQTDFLIPLGEKLLPTLKTGLTWIKDNLNWLLPVLTNIGVVIGTYFAVTKFMSLISVITQIINLVRTGTTVMGALNVVLNMNPIGLIVTAVVGLIAAFAALWQNCEGFREFWIGLWDTITGFCKNAIDGIVGFFNGIINFIKENWQTMLLFIVNPFAGAFKLLYEKCEWFRNIVDTIKNKVVGIFTKLKDGVVDKITAIKTKISDVFGKVTSIITKPVEKARDTVKKVVDKIKGFFDFEFKLPKIKTPKFGIKPKGWKLSDLLDGTIPKLNVEWHAKGGIFTKPTVLNTANGVHGFAEKGHEAILPLERLESWMNSGFSKVVNNNYYASEKIDRLIEVAEAILDKPSDIYIDKNRVGGALAETNDNISGQRINFKNRGVMV